MQAILFKGLNQPLQLGTVATPVPAADEVLIGSMQVRHLWQ